jgi:hypothetical protein
MACASARVRARGFAEHRLAGARARLDLGAVLRMRRRQHDRRDRGIGQHRVEAFGRREAMLRREPLDLVGRAVDAAHEADLCALATLDGLAKPLAPATEADDRGVDHASL